MPGEAGRGPLKVDEVKSIIEMNENRTFTFAGDY
jgi:hypothetical protein